MKVIFDSYFLITGCLPSEPSLITTFTLHHRFASEQEIIVATVHFCALICCLVDLNRMLIPCRDRMHVHTVALHVLDIARCRLPETLPMLITLTLITTINSSLNLNCADSVSTILIDLSWFLHHTVLVSDGIVIDHD